MRSMGCSNAGEAAQLRQAALEAVGALDSERLVAPVALIGAGPR